MFIDKLKEVEDAKAAIAKAEDVATILHSELLKIFKDEFGDAYREFKKRPCTRCYPDVDEFWDINIAVTLHEDTGVLCVQICTNRYSEYREMVHIPVDAFESQDTFKAALNQIYDDAKEDRRQKYLKLKEEFECGKE